MSALTSIEWCDSTANYWEGCSKVSTEESGGGGCDNCYAEAMNHWLRRGENWGSGAPRRKFLTTQRIVRSWQRNAGKFNAQHGRRRRVFVNSISDTFDNEVPQEWRDEIWADARACPDLLFMVVTKRIGNARAMLPADWRGGYQNVMLLATVVNQREADREVQKLLALPARWRGLSVEPQLGPIDLRLGRPATEQDRQDCDGLVTYIHTAAGAGLHLVINGGESNRRARPMHPDWARNLRDQVHAAGRAYLFKQWGEWLPWSQFTGAMVDDPPEQTRFQTLEYFDGRWDDVGRPGYLEVMDGDVDDEQCVGRVGKRAAGRLLDGVEHLNFPGDFR